MQSIQWGSVQHVVIVILVAFGSQNAVADAWPQWGGASRDFSVSSAKLADKWPADGPPKLWSRSLGDGYTSIVSDGEMLFTMYRPFRPSLTSDREIVVGLDATTGKTVWQHGYESKLTEPVAEWGHGPNSTPVLSGDRLYAIGTNSVVRCFDKYSGTLHWKRDLIAEFSSPLTDGVGYTISPVIYKDSLIVPLGNRRDKSSEFAEESPPGPMPATDGRNRSVIALSLSDGSLLWQGGSYLLQSSSPMIIAHGGQDQIIMLIDSGLASVDASTGKELWQLAFEQDGGHVMTPVWDGGDLLFVASSQDSSGGRLIRLTSEGGKTVPREVWFSRKIKTAFGNPVRDGDNLYVSGGSRIGGFDLKTGKRYWSKGGFDTTSVVLADRKLIILDQNGKLTLATPSPKDLVVHSEFQVTERYSFSCPTLVGDKLFIRDRKNILALDVGVGK